MEHTKIPYAIHATIPILRSSTLPAAHVMMLKETVSMILAHIQFVNCVTYHIALEKYNTPV
jgi:hypothetical protein